MLSLAAAVSASVVIGAIAVEASTASDAAANSANGSPRAHSPSAISPETRLTSTPTASPNVTPNGTGGSDTVAVGAYGPPRPGRYSYDGPGGTTVTTVVVHPTAPGTWEVDESIAAHAGVLQSRRETWTRSGVRILGVWEASQPRPCVWSNAPIDVGFPLHVGSAWSVDASCRISHGTAGDESMRVQGSFRTTQRTALAIGGRSVLAWLVVGNEVTTSDGTVNGHRYHTVDRTTTRVWFVPRIGLPGRTELTGTVAITSEKGMTRHRISQVTQLKSLTPQ